jgi:hypothetical protein
MPLTPSKTISYQTEAAVEEVINKASSPLFYWSTNSLINQLENEFPEVLMQCEASWGARAILTCLLRSPRRSSDDYDQ